MKRMKWYIMCGVRLSLRAGAQNSVVRCVWARLSHEDRWSRISHDMYDCRCVERYPGWYSVCDVLTMWEDSDWGPRLHWLVGSGRLRDQVVRSRWGDCSVARSEWILQDGRWRAPVILLCVEGGQDGTAGADHNVPTDVSLSSSGIVRVDFRKAS